MSLSDTVIYEYALVLRPHEALQERILHIRKDFNEQFSVDNPYFSTPQIALVRFQQTALMQEKWLRRIHLLSMGYTPFRVELRNFCCTPTHSISFNIHTTLPVINCIKAIRTEAQHLLKMDEEHTPHFLMEPHIPLASKLLPWQFEKGWQQMQQLHFNAAFIADHIFVMRRKQGTHKYFPLQQFKMMNIIASRQGNLFM